MALKLPRLPGNTAITDGNGLPTIVYSSWWQAVVQTIENSINGIAEALAAALAAQGSADVANANAAAAQADATAAQGSAAAAQTTANTGVTNASTAQTTANTALANAATAQTTANSKITQATADGLYVHQDLGPAWTAATGTASRAAYAAYVSPTISNPPTQAEMQTLSDAVQDLSQRMVALITDLKANSTLT